MAFADPVDLGGECPSDAHLVTGNEHTDGENLGNVCLCLWPKMVRVKAAAV